MICFKDYKIINIWIDSELTTYQISWISGLGLRRREIYSIRKRPPELQTRNLFNLITWLIPKVPGGSETRKCFFLNWLKKGKRHFRTMLFFMKFTSQAPGEKSIKLDDFSIRIQLENDLPSSRPEIYSIWPFDRYQKSPWWIGDTKVFFS